MFWIYLDIANTNTISLLIVAAHTDHLDDPDPDLHGHPDSVHDPHDLDPAAQSPAVQDSC